MQPNLPTWGESMHGNPVKGRGCINHKQKMTKDKAAKYYSMKLRAVFTGDWEEFNLWRKEF